MSKVKLERLLNLTALLIETPRPLTADEIHDRLAGYPESQVAFHRAFERDKHELRTMGIPLSVEAAPGVTPAVESYRIHKQDYYLDDPGLDADELAALHLAAGAVRLQGTGVEDGLVKLEGATGSPDPEAPEPQPAELRMMAGGDGEVAAVPAQDGLGELFGAVVECRPVRFRYSGEERTVDPYRVDFQRGRWYLKGYDHLRRSERVYRLDRLETGVDVLPEPTFSRPPSVGPAGPADPWQLGGDETVHARLAVDADQAPWIVGRLGEQAVVERRDDGSVVVEQPVSNRENFRSFVLIFQDHAEVLGPPELREDMVRWLTALAGGGDDPGGDGGSPRDGDRDGRDRPGDRSDGAAGAPEDPASIAPASGDGGPAAAAGKGP